MLKIEFKLYFLPTLPNFHSIFKKKVDASNVVCFFIRIKVQTKEKQLCDQGLNIRFIYKSKKRSNNIYSSNGPSQK